MVCWSKNILQRGQVVSKIGNFQGYTITCVLLTQSCSTVCDPWTIACQASLSMEFPRQEYWSGLSFPSLGCIPNPGIEPESPELQADSLPSEPPCKQEQLFSCSVVSDSATPWTVACQAPLSMEFSRQEYWVAISFSRGSSRPRDRTCIPYIVSPSLSHQRSPISG